MKRLPLIFTVVACAAFMLAPAGVFTQRSAAAEQPAPPATSKQPTKLGSILDEIHQAPDPSSAISAYAKGSAIAPDNPALEAAFVTRMVELGLPQMAQAQAQDLVQHEPKNGLAWGALAYTLASRGQMSEALIDLGHAVQYLPNDAFVQRTAGQLMAWYDAVADQSTLSDAAKQAVAGVSSALVDQRAYVEAYQAAREAYEEPNAAEQPEATAIVPAPEDYAQAVPPVYNSYTYNYGAPSDVYPYAPYPDYLPYPEYVPQSGFIGGYYGGYWWPNTSSVIIVPRDEGARFHHRRSFTWREPALGDFLAFPGHRQPGLLVGHGEEHGAFGTPHHGEHGLAWGSHSRGTEGRFGRSPNHRFSEPLFAPREWHGSRSQAFVPRTFEHRAAPSLRSEHSAPFTHTPRQSFTFNRGSIGSHFAPSHNEFHSFGHRAWSGSHGRFAPHARFSGHWTARSSRPAWRGSHR